MLKKTLMPGLFLMPLFGHAAVEQNKQIEKLDRDQIVNEETAGRTDTAKQDKPKQNTDDFNDAIETTRHLDRLGTGQYH